MRLSVPAALGLIALALAALPLSPAFAQAQRITFMGGDRAVQNAFKINPKVAVPAYQISFITAQQGTAAANIGARARLTSVLTGVPPELMKQLANEAHADLKARLVAAGVPLVDDQTALSTVTEVEALPGNTEIKPLTSSITIGKGVQKAWATFGADAAPALKPYNNPAANPMAQMGAFGAGRTIAQGSRRIGAAVIIPSLIIDFVETSASTGMGMMGARANIDTDVKFSLRMGSATHFVSTIPAGPAVGASGALGLSKDVVSPTPFATVAVGEAAVRALSTGPNDGLGNRNSRGDAVVVDLPVWEGLVRQTYQDYNAALVAAVVKGRT